MQLLVGRIIRVVPFIEHGNRAHGGCDRSTGDAYSSMAPDPTSGVSRGSGKPDFYCALFQYLNWTLILTADFSVNLTKRSDFDSGLFRLLNFDTQILTTILTFDIGHMAGATGWQEMLTPPWHLIPPLIYSEVRVRPFFDLYFL
jgi:hypothetical protein